jgi:hypothetical protein
MVWRQSTEKHFSEAFTFLMLRRMLEVGDLFQQSSARFFEFAFQSDQGNEHEQEVVHEVHFAPVPAHRCNDWIQWCSQSNRNRDIVNSLDAESGARSGRP